MTAEQRIRKDGQPYKEREDSEQIRFFCKVREHGGHRYEADALLCLDQSNSFKGTRWVKGIATTGTFDGSRPKPLPICKTCGTESRGLMLKNPYGDLIHEECE